MNPAIINVNMDFTTRCDRRCPECCCGIGINRVLADHTWEYFERAAEILRGANRINLCGGEPTFHRRFADFVPRMRALFQCERLTMTTDGWGVERYRDIIIRHIDHVDFTEYHTHPQARALVQQIDHSIFDAGKQLENFTPRAHRGSGQPCHRAVFNSGAGIAYADGKIYGCCVAPGIDGALPVDPSHGWDFRIFGAPLPCAECWFSE